MASPYGLWSLQKITRAMNAKYRGLSAGQNKQRDVEPDETADFPKDKLDPRPPWRGIASPTASIPR